MADGSPGRRACPQQIVDLTFSAPDNGLDNTKKCSEDTVECDRVKLSFYTELESKDSGEASVSRRVVVDRDRSATTGQTTGSQSSCENEKSTEDGLDGDGEERKKRCFDRYDSSESSDSGVAVLSSTESSGCSSSDITEPRSPQSPESGCSVSGGEEVRMPPWASEPAPPRRLPPQPAPARRVAPPIHRRITEFFSHKMKPQNLKRESPAVAPDDTKRRCLQKNGVTHDLEKYISYLSQTLSPKLLDVGKQAEAAAKKTPTMNGVVDISKHTDLSRNGTSVNGIDYSRSREKVHTTMNGFVDIRNGTESVTKEKQLNGQVDGKKKGADIKTSNPSANGILNKHITDLTKRKVPISAPSELNGIRTGQTANVNQFTKKLAIPKEDNSKMNGIVSSTTKLDCRMNGVTHGSNNISLNPIACKPMPAKKEAPKKTTTPKRTNRKSSACIANSKNLTWSKANNLKQIQLQKQNCANVTQSSPVKTIPGEGNTAPKMNIPNGVRQVSMAVNGNLGNLNVPVTNFQNCQINIPQPCNGTVTSNNLGSFVAMPQNVMLTTLRIPQNGIPAQTLNQQNNMNAYSRPNVNVTSSPTKLNGQFVFPLMQNLNGAVVQIPNLMAKMPNFVLPQTAQLAQRQEHLQNQQAAQYIINGTLLKLANTMNSSYPNVNKPGAPTSQSIPVMSKSVTSMPTVGMTVQPKPNYTVNLSHPVLVPQPGFIVTSVPNINVKETWSYTSTTHVASSQTSCSNPIVHHPPPIVNNFTTQTLHSSSIPIAPVKPPDNPIQGTEPPSSTVQDEVTSQKCDIPWLSKTVNNNNVLLDSKLPPRPFAQLGSLTNKLEQFEDKEAESKIIEDKNEQCTNDTSSEALRKVEEVARREETIFTQITVLKDVSSNVQSSLIEANFCSATTESSESGIGTSIDSPNSDSQTSKECDEDSLSLSVSIFSSETSQNSVCQKSPILKQPKTLRFPPRNPTKSSSDKRKSSTDTASSVTVCMWENCKREFDSDTDLLEHLQAIHVESQAGKENFVCLWERCKVRGKPSCSRLWLERHTLSHGGNKPFKCIVDGCERRFTTQILLERHVNNHFNEASPNTSGAKKTTDSASKLIRRNGKKLRYRRQPWSARMFDFFDAGTMEGLAWRLSRSTRWRLGGSCPLREPAGRHTLTLHAALTATRYNAAEARREALLTYYPPHVIEDEWVPENDVKRIKRVEIAELPAHTKVLLYEQFCSSYRKTPSPPPPKKTKEAQANQQTPARLLPARHCTSSRLLNNLLAKQRKERSDCSATNQPMIYGEEEKEKVAEVSGAKKRKMGRRYGGNAFWPCGR